MTDKSAATGDNEESAATDDHEEDPQPCMYQLGSLVGDTITMYEFENETAGQHWLSRIVDIDNYVKNPKQMHAYTFNNLQHLR